MPLPNFPSRLDFGDPNKSNRAPTVAGLWRGTTFERRVKFVDDATGLPVDLTGHLARMDIRADYTSAPVLSLSEVSGITVDPSGFIDIAITPAQSQAISVTGSNAFPGEAKFFYDLELENPAGDIFPVLFGLFSIFQEVTEE